jgi:hypothetical protein
MVGFILVLSSHARNLASILMAMDLEPPGDQGGARYIYSSSPGFVLISSGIGSCDVAQASSWLDNKQ